ncbi:MAG: hypothetical protein ACTHMF_04540 [Leifsonia sp.]|uniref:hypothetical protein n=1 Tax=Leifsonia sp. TaxID=1870902 RepID=UPI003F7E3FB0
MRFRALAVAVAFTMSSTAAASPGAGSPVESPKLTAETRVVDRTSEKMPVDAAAMDSLRARARATIDIPTTSVAAKPIPLPPDVAIRPGETVQVDYSDGVAVHRMLAPACTSTSTVDTPYVSGGYAWSYHTHGLSAGCPGSASVNGILSSLAPPWWWQRDFTTVTVTPGSTLYWPTNRKCESGGATSWHSENAIGSSVTALSPDRSLACNPG